MQSLSAIVAYCKGNKGIGKDGGLPFRLPEDMAHFRKMTTGKTVVMGRKTYMSLPQNTRPLPNRRNIVLTRNTSAIDACVEHMTLDDFLVLFNDGYIEGEVFVIGGEQVYTQLLPYIGTIHITEVEIDGMGCDTFFPDFDKDEFSVVDDSGLLSSKEGGQKYRFLTYKRKKVSNIK